MSSASRTTAILSKRLRTSSSRRALSTTSIVQNQSSSTSSSTWTRSLPEGSNPAYDASLVFLAQHSSSLLDKAERLRGKLSSVQDAELKSTIEIALKKTELEARIARPETRWLHENENAGQVGGEAEAGDKEALNVMAERRWRKMGKLDRLMERILTMNVVPDLVALPNPEIDMSISFPTGSVSEAVPGDYLLPSQTLQQPKISLRAFTNDETEQLYTLVMVDPDLPDTERLSYKEYCHWIVPNIPISRNTTSIPASITASLDFVPPHPSPESPYHRYTLLLLRQPTPTLSSSDKEKGDKLDSSATTAFLPTTPQDRSNFNLREWMVENNFSTSSSDASSVKGIFMFREGGKGFGQKVGYKRTSKEWKEEERVVDGVWKEVWGRERAVYEKSPKEERFGYPIKY